MAAPWPRLQTALQLVVCVLLTLPLTFFRYAAAAHPPPPALTPPP